MPYNISKNQPKYFVKFPKYILNLDPSPTPQNHHRFKPNLQTRKVPMFGVLVSRWESCSSCTRSYKNVPCAV